MRGLLGIRRCINPRTVSRCCSSWPPPPPLRYWPEYAPPGPAAAAPPPPPLLPRGVPPHYSQAGPAFTPPRSGVPTEGGAFAGSPPGSSLPGRTYSQDVKSDSTSSSDSFSALVSSFYSRGMLQEVDQVFRGISSAQIFVSVPTYRNFIDIYGQLRDFDRMDMVYAEMKKAMMKLAGHQIPEQTFRQKQEATDYFTQLLDSCFRRGLFQEVQLVYKAMKMAQLPISVPSYKLLIESYSQLKNWGEMDAVYMEMKDLIRRNGPPPSSYQLPPFHHAPQFGQPLPQFAASPPPPPPGQFAPPTLSQPPPPPPPLQGAPPHHLQFGPPPPSGMQFQVPPHLMHQQQQHYPGPPMPPQAGGGYSLPWHQHQHQQPPHGGPAPPAVPPPPPPPPQAAQQAVFVEEAEQAQAAPEEDVREETTLTIMESSGAEAEEEQQQSDKEEEAAGEDEDATAATESSVEAEDEADVEKVEPSDNEAEAEDNEHQEEEVTAAEAKAETETEPVQESDKQKLMESSG